MNLQEARELLGNRAIWELINMRKALTFLGALNTLKEDKRLEAVKILLKQRRWVK